MAETKKNRVSWIGPTLRSLLGLEELQPNWDGYGSPAIQPIALQSARRLVEAMDEFELPLPQVMPVTGGGITLLWRVNGRELEIEVLADGSSEFLAVSTDPTTGQETTQEDSLPLAQAPVMAAWLLND